MVGISLVMYLVISFTCLEQLENTMSRDDGKKFPGILADIRV